MYISSHIENKKLSPTFLCVSKFDVKLGSWDFIFKIHMGKCVFENHAKSVGFRLAIWSQNLRFTYFFFLGIPFVKLTLQIYF